MRSHLLRLVLLFLIAAGFVLSKASGTVAAVEPTPDTFMDAGSSSLPTGFV